jgi:hypothetical protein
MIEATWAALGASQDVRARLVGREGPMTKWEYEVHTADEGDNIAELTERLRQAGADEWELVAVHPDNSGFIHLYYKRPLPETR